MKKLILFFTFLMAISLSACQKNNDQSQLKNTVQTLQSSIKIQQAALETIEKTANEVPDNFITLQKKQPDQNLATTTDSNIATAITKRDQAFDDLIAAQSEIEQANKQLKKYTTQKNNAVETLKDLRQSLEISALDYKNLSRYQKQVQTTEKDFYQALSDTNFSHQTNITAITAQAKRLNQIYNALHQQVEISQVNLSPALSQVNTLKNKTAKST